MQRHTTFIYLICAVLAVFAAASTAQRQTHNSDELVSTVLTNCIEMQCVKSNVLSYLDGLLSISGGDRDAKNIKNYDSAIYKRVAKLLKTHEFRVTLPQTLFDQSELVYNPKYGLDVATKSSESRGLLKKKLLLPILLLLKLKMKALMPIFVALIGLKAMKALILSKLAIAIVLGFVVYQLIGKSGMPMPMMSMQPAEPPTPIYGAPPPTTMPPSSYDPSSWEPSPGGGPYSRIWSSNDAASAAYSAYYQPVSSSTSSP